MNLKEIIIEELEREFFGNNELHQYDKDRIEQTANNIISKMDWQVIGRLSGDQFEYLSFEKNKGRDFIKTRKYPKIITVEIAVREIKQNS